MKNMKKMTSERSVCERMDVFVTKYGRESRVFLEKETKLKSEIWAIY